MKNAPVHIITVGANRDELARTAKLVEVLQPLSHRECAKLEDLNDAAYGDDAFTMLRLFGGANTQVLTWLGSKGRVATEVAVLGYADAVLIEPGQPARAIGVLPQAFVSAVAASKISVDTSSAAFLIGALDETKSMAAALARVGFKRLLIVDSDDRKTEQIAAHLRRRLLGIDIVAIPRRSLTQVPNESSVAVSMADVGERSLLEDVSYLNFLKKNGILIDWTCASSELGFDAEIKDAGATIFDAIGIRAWREAWLLNHVPAMTATGQKPDDVAALLLEGWKISPS